MRPADDKQSRRYEVFRPSFGGTVAVFVFIAIAALISHAALWDWWTRLKGPAAVDSAKLWNPADQGTRRGTVALLQTNPPADFVSFKAQQSVHMRELAWVDRDRGIARVPIDMAIETILSNGLPQWSTNSKISPIELQWQRAGLKGGER